MAKKIFTKEVKIALVAIVGVIILFGGLQFLKGLNIFSPGKQYFISFKDISGLSTSSPIYADGYKVGTVKDVLYDYDKGGNIQVEVTLNEDLRIPKGSSAEIVSDMLGNVKVNLLLANNPRERIEEGGLIDGTINDGALGQMKGMVPTVERILPKLDSIATNLNILLSNPAIAQSIRNVEVITGNLTTASTELNVLMSNLNRNVPGMINKTNDVLDNTNKLTGNLAQLDVEGTVARINKTLEEVQSFTNQLNNNNGTLGLMMRDPSLYNNLNATMMSADSLLINMKAHPKRYVHFSIFGKKDK